MGYIETDDKEFLYIELGYITMGYMEMSNVK